MKKVFITGAAGFIGFHAAMQLAKRGDYVIGFDNFNDYYDPALKYQRAELLRKAGVQVIQGDICDFDALNQAVKNHQTTHLLHLAAQAGVRYSLQNPHAYIKSNVEGFLNILETCKLLPHIKLIYASSSSVYGNSRKVPFSLDDTTDSQASLYGMTKKSNELMAATYNSLYGIATTGLRFFTVYGPWGRPDMAYFSFAKAIHEGKPIQLFNHGEMERDFTYVDDIVQGIQAAVDLGAEQEIFNLGNNRPEKLIELVRALEMGLQKKAVIEYLPMQAGDVVKTYADISHSQEVLRFNPSVTLSEGINSFVDWYLDMSS